MRTAKLLLTLLALTAIGVPAQALEECHEDPYDLKFVDPLTGNTYYVVNDPCQTSGCLYSVWIYQETNGVAELQRCDESHMDENCWCPPDTVIF